MQTNSYRNIVAKLLATTALTLVITGAPVTVDIDDAGMISLKPLVAMAKGGGDDDGDSDNSGSGSDSSGSGSDGSDDSDNSGSGSDSSGSGSDGSDDSDDSDNSGPGSENSGSGSDDDDDDDDDDSSGSGSSSSESGETEITLSDGTKIEVSGDNIEVEFANGWKEEIEDGRYEMKDPSGNTVVERTATEEDRTRLESFLP